MADEEIVRSYARDVLGMKDDEMDEYLWLAEESMRAPMPPWMTRGTLRTGMDAADSVRPRRQSISTDRR